MTSDQFRAALKALNLPQRQLALALGLDVGTVNRWARGILPVPQYAEAYLELAKKSKKTAE
jgi:transcriptional regulator with XRE-family HTH domain